ncbi:RNA polymerase sigma factor RpoE [Mergibacter septicus]|uniref:RNA polymerase sigma factor n=1 Tax=Mergibacter septicus TaxID=221402 RepID=A0A8E3MDV8_9PAST|nr:RNA polymerase sigma factor RpoE [Mergibacter septicus]AWX15950.1 RNA polymerase sigma factor RpoE [Mergibacter septicus]QDJ13426.1 RNA polymerase sigma factor RpoE [Mergibacter septicus]QDJ15203.1 RNA polymerase sigma factor RpoE [Mergibacter septicus]UTU47376.1 RNA polymerase sigma factor RpoE [Mergibacter septicus]WMR95444.1 RNA polymerase sigma factor RpoE [Mergibacter septicus]
MSEQLTDQSLIEKVKQGNKQAFNLLVSRYQNRVAGIVNRFVSPSDVPDLVQETFLRVYRSLHTFRNDSAFSTWLYAIATNVAKAHLMNEKKRFSSEVIPIEETEGFDDDKLKEIETPENIFLSNEIKRTVMETLENLPEDLRKAFLLREVEGLNYEEIAKQLNCPIGTVRSRLFRAREIIEGKIAPLRQIHLRKQN